MLTRLLNRMRMLLDRRRLEADLAEEIEFHLEMKAAAHRESGMAAEEARYAAARSFGNRTLVREESRAFWGWEWLERLGQDLRYGFRALRSHPGFTAVAVLTLALGIGANTAVFTLINGIILQSLPVPHPDELISIRLHGTRGDVRTGFSYPFYRDLRDRNTVLSGLAAWWTQSAAVSWHGVAEHVQGQAVTGNYFRVLGVRPALGRLLVPDDDRMPRGNAVCVLSTRLWRQRFGGDPEIVGGTILLNTVPFTVAGITPDGFSSSEPGVEPDFFVPVTMRHALMRDAEDMLVPRYYSVLMFVGRAKRGLTSAQVRDGLQNAINGIARDIDKNDGGTVEVRSGSQGMGWRRHSVERPLLILGAMTALVLLIACANLAALLVARGAARRREIAVRIAIGAGRLRIIRQLMTESLLLAVGGGLFSIPVALAGVSALLSLAPGDGALSLQTSPDWSVLAFLSAAVGMATVLFGLAPAIANSRVDTVPALKDMPMHGRTRLTLRRGLVVVQVALSVVMLTAAGLFAGSLRKIRAIDPGLRPENLVLATVNPKLSGYTAEKSIALHRMLLERARGMAGVRSASLSAVAPLSGALMDRHDVMPEGYQGRPLVMYLNLVSSQYFRTMGIPLVAGRDFEPGDRQGAPLVAVVSEDVAKHFWPGQNPIGKRVRWAERRSELEIIGVARQHKYQDITAEPQWTVYTPLAQGMQAQGCSEACEEDVVLTVRAAGDPNAVVTAIREVVRALDPNLPVYNVRTMSAVIDRSVAGDRLIAVLSGAFGMLALLLVAIGLYGVIAYNVARRTREIGVRIALGAATGDVVRLVLRESAGMMGLGLVLGLPCAWWASRAIASLLYGLSPHEPLVYAAVPCILAAVMLAAAYVPARRATRIEPTHALRFE